MAQQDDNIKRLYEELKNEYDVGSIQDFRNYLDKPENRKALYGELRNEYEINSEKDFDDYLGFGETTQAGIAAQQVVDEYDRSVAENGRSQQPQRAATQNVVTQNDNDVKQQEVKPTSQPRAQFVPEYSNVKGFTVAKDSPLRQQYPFLDQLGEDEQAYFRTDTNEPLYAWKDSEGKDITPDEAATLNQRADIEQNDAIRPRQVPVTSLQLPEEVKSSGIRTDKKVSEYADELLKKQHGDGYLDRQITLNDGTTVSGDEMLGKVSQQVYDNLNKQINEARVTYVSADNAGRERIINQFVNNYKGLLSEATVKRALEEHDALQEATAESERRNRAEWAQMKEDNPSFWQTLRNSVSAGFINFGAGLLDAIQQLTSGMLIEDPSRKEGYFRTRSYEEALADKNDPITKLTGILHGKAERLSKSAQPYKGKKGFLDMLWNGEITEFLQKGVATAGESLPMTLSAFNPYTMAINAISMAGSNFRQNTLDNPNIPAWKRAMQAIGSAAIEQAVEKYSDPIFKYVGGNKVLRGVSKENSEKIVRDVTEEAVNTLSGRIFNRLKGLAKDTAGEGVEEVMADAGNDLLGETLDLVSGSTDYGLRAQWEEFKEDNPNADLKTFAKNKAKEYVEDFIGGAMAGAYTSSTTQLSAKALQYSFDKIGAAQNQVDPTRLNPVQVDIAQSYDDGYNAESGEVAEMTDNYNRQRMKVESTFSLETVTEIDNDPISLLDSGSIKGEDMQTVIDYVNAKARYDGIMQRNSDDAETGVDHRNLHSDGMIHAAVLYPSAESGGQPQEVFIIKGDIVADANGKVDVEKSSDMITYRGADGLPHIASPDKFQSVAQPISVEEYAAANAPQESVAQTDNATTIYSPGDEVVLKDDNGNAVRGEIMYDANADGQYQVRTESPINGANVNLFTGEELDNLRYEQPSQQENITDEYSRFVDSGIVSDDTVARIADKIANGQQLTPEEESMRQGAVERVENLLKEKQTGQNGQPVQAEQPIQEAAKTAQTEQTSQPQQTEASVQEQTALSRIPVDEKGKPAYDKAEPDLAWDAIMEKTDGDEEMAKNVVDAMVKQQEAEVDKLKKKQPKAIPGDVDSMIAAQKEKKAAIAAAEERLEQWKKIADTPNRRAAAANVQPTQNPSDETSTQPAAAIAPTENTGNVEPTDTGNAQTTEQGAKVPAGVQGTVEDGTVPERTSEDRQEGGSVPVRTEEVESATEGLTSEDALRKGKLQYRFDGGAQTEHRPADVSVTTPLAGQGASSKGNATIGDQSVSDMENGTLVSPQLASSESKDTQTSANEQTVGEKIAQEEAKVEQNPTEAQKEAGNYKKGHVKIDGYDVTIENPKGSVRKGTDRNGQEWSVTMNNTYGYIRGTEGVDGDHIDVFLSDDPTQGDVYVIDQVNEDGSFDEHKVMYGFNSAEEARDAYLANYSPGWQGLGTITKVSKEEFKKWINSSHRKTKPFADYKSVNKDGAQNEGNTLANEAHELFSDIIAQSTHNVEINDSGISETDNTLYAPIKVDGKDTSLSLYQEEPAHSSEEPIVGVSFYRDGMTYQEAADVSDEYNKYVGERVCADGSDELAINFGSIDEAVRFEEWLNDNRGVRFREMEDDGNKSLVGVHNITEDKLVKAIRQGGLANPSVAVIDADRQTHEGYGEISLIMPSNKINRRTGHNAGTFTNDAWTPMYPPIERQFGKGGSERAAQDIASVAEEMRSEVRQGINSWMDGRNGIGLEYLFLHERNEAPLTVRVEPVYPERLRNEVAEIMNGKDSFMDLDEAEKQSIVNLLVRERYDGDSAKYTDEIKQRIKHDEERIAKRPNSLFSRRVKMDVDFMKEYGYDYSEAKSFVDAIVEDGRTAGTTDTRATLTAAQSAIAERGLQEEYDKWLDGLNDRYNINEVIFDGFTPSGNRRYVPNTLENVSRLMKKNGRNGATGLGTSFSNFAASVLKAKGTLNDIRKMKGNLTSEHKNVDEFREKWGNVFYELGNKLQPDATGFEDYGLARLAEAATQKKPRKYIKDEYGIEMSDDDVKKLDDMIRAIRENYPAMYFETKFERPVYFNEFTAAVVPNNIKPSTRKTLEDAGLKLFEYDPNMEGDRQRIFNEATREEGVRFRSDENLFNYDGLLTRNGIDAAVADTANKLNVGVRVAHSVDEVGDEGVRRAIEKGRNVKGWYDTRTGEIVVYAPNATDADDAVRTVLHEGVAHYGLRQLVGDENFDTFLDNIYNNVDEGIKAAIDEKAQRHGWSTRVATEEYLASLAEDTNFEEAKSSGLWQKIKDFFMDLLTKTGVRLNEALTDNELRYLLWRSYENLAEPNGRDIIGTVRDVAMQGRLGVGNYGNEGVRLRETDNAQAQESQGAAQENDEGTTPTSAYIVDAWDKQVKSDRFKLVETGIDYLNAVDKFQKLIAKHSGKEIKSFENAYDAMTFLSSKNREEMDMFESFFVTPLNKAIQKLIGEKGGLKKWDWSKGPLRELVMYVEAKHGTERNRQMAVEAVAKADEKNSEAILKDWAAAKKRINEQEGTSWQEKQRLLDKAAASLGADLSKDYSGLSSVFGDKDAYPKGWQEESLEYVSKYESGHEAEDINGLWTAIGNATGFALQKQYETGLVSREYVERQKERFDNYIPLRGFEDEIAGDVYSYLGHDFYPGSNPVKTAHGRTSEPGNPFGSILNTAYASISSGNKNVAKTALYSLVVNHDTGGLAVAKRAWMVKYADLKNNPELESVVISPKIEGDEEIPEWVEAVPRIPKGDKEKNIEPTAQEISKVLADFEAAMKKYQKEDITKPVGRKAKIAYKTLHNERDEHDIPLFIAGDKYIITITGNPRVAQAMNGLLNPDSGEENTLTEYAKKTQRFMSGAFTAKNAAFSFANLAKDTIYANNQAFIRENPKYWLRFTENQRLGFGDFIPMMRRLKRYRNGKLDLTKKRDRMFKEFMENGGATGYTFVNTQEEYAKELAKKLDELSKKTPKALSLKGLWNIFFDTVEFMGQAAELVNRFAAYKTSREMGRTVNRSIRDAKEITVNFNRKGAGRKTADKNNKWYINLAAATSQYGRTSILFWNANMQAKYRFFKNIQEHPIKTSVTLIANSMAIGGAIIPFINNLALPALYEMFGIGGDDDDDDYYNALTDWERTHNICLRLPKGYWLKIPLSPEMTPWYSMGDAIGGAASGQRDLSAKDFMESAIDAVSPLSINWSYSGSQMLLNALPTVGQPLFQNMMNVNFMGNPIKKTPFTRRQGKNPEYTMVYRSASPTLVELSRLSNRILGGEDDKTAGEWRDWNPAMVQNLISGYAGGYGTTILSIADWIVNTSKGEKQAVAFSKIPFVSRFVISGNKDVKRQRINSRYNDVKEFVTDFEFDMGRYEKRVEEAQKKADPVKLSESMSEYDKLLSSERTEKYMELYELDRSIKYYEDYLDEFPDDEVTQNLLYNLKQTAIETLKGEKEEKEKGKQ